MKTSIITVTHQSYRSLQRLRESLKAHTKNYDWVIVDNGSKRRETHVELEHIEAAGDATVIRNKKNLYFTKACNQGIEVATGDYIVLLNPDCMVTDGWLDSLIITAETTSAGIVGCILVNEVNEIVHAGGIGLGDHPGFGMPYDPEMDVVQTRPHKGWVTGACLLISRACLNAVGGKLNESMRHYYSDIDLCESAKKAGFEIWVSNHVLVHSVGGSGV